MIVHLGVVILAVGIVASTSYVSRAEVTLKPGQTLEVHGHTITFVGMRTITSPAKQSNQVVLRIDGDGTFAPGISQFAGRGNEPVGTPSIDSGIFGDLYLTFDAIGRKGGTSGAQIAGDVPSGSVVIGVLVEPLLAWLWVGGLTMGLGGLLAFIPTRRRRTTSTTATSVTSSPPETEPVDTPVGS